MIKEYKSGKYVGEGTVHGVRHGWGTYTWNDGIEHKGFFIDGEMRGFGIRTNNGRETYRGEWLGSEKHGCGQERREEDRYIDGFYKGEYRGSGVYSRESRI